MARQPVLIRVDANPSIGAGHLMRCLALAEAFRRRGRRCFFITRETSPAFTKIIDERRFRRVQLHRSLGFQQEPAALFRLKLSAVGFVVDRYGLPAGYLQAIRRERPDWTLLQFDDEGKALKGADLILNQNFHANPKSYRKTDACLLLGPRYAVIRESVLGKKPIRIARDVRRVAVTLGAGRAPALARLGAAVRKTLSGRRILEARGLRPGAMAALLSKCDLALTAAGTTLLELSYLGIPNVCVVLAANQSKAADAAHRLGATHSLGWIESVKERSVRETVSELAGDWESRRRMHRRQLALVDGRGGARVVRAFEALRRAS